MFLVYSILALSVHTYARGGPRISHVHHPRGPPPDTLFESSRPANACTSCTPLTKGNDIEYHGGMIMPGTVNLYLVWYGRFSRKTIDVTERFLLDFGGSPRAEILSTYWDYYGHGGEVRWATGQMSLAASTHDENYSRGLNLTIYDIAAIAGAWVDSGTGVADPDGIYIVLTDPDVWQTTGGGFYSCIDFCAWHWVGSYAPDSKLIKVVFVGSTVAPYCTWPGTCNDSYRFFTTTASGDAAADGYASLLAHELGESVNDPFDTAWYDDAEMAGSADKCRGTFGSLLTANANVEIRGNYYFIQQEWVNDAGGYCASRYDRSGGLTRDLTKRSP